ncbi:hypothetical protein HDU87_008840 [Geranomyces variabilis]|uniref:Uncharacterized protein n=1 Tax=Geranomyces variabilis TaxID=109894 RepID=A0AAD5XP00_9FUNG|nr:hypothetical protein HDU87_008840 [Geranomyces variabilis]
MSATQAGPKRGSLWTDEGTAIPLPPQQPKPLLAPPAPAHQTSSPSPTHLAARRPSAYESALQDSPRKSIAQQQRHFSVRPSVGFDDRGGPGLRMSIFAPPLVEDKSLLPKSEWPKVDLPPVQDPGIFSALKAAKLSGMSYTSPVQIEELNARIRRMASTLRLIDPEVTDLRLQVEEFQPPAQRPPSQQPRKADQHRDSSTMGVTGGRRIFDSVYHTNIPVISTEEADESEMQEPPSAHEMRSIKKAHFPGVNPPPPLPHTASSPRKLIAKAAQGCRANRRVRAKLLLPETERMLCDVFWHVFLTHTQPTGEKEAKDELFARIAASYVHVLLKTDSRDRNDLSFTFTSVLSSAVAAAFLESFPNSTKEFDAAFEVRLSDQLSEWIIGMRPTFANGWRSSSAMGDNNRSASTLHRGASTAAQDNFLDLMGGDGTQDAARNALAAIPSAYIGCTPQTRRVLFDANGNSLLLAGYLGKAERRIVNIHRTEAPREMPSTPRDGSASRQTYRQALADSARRSRALQRAYKAKVADAQREKLRLLQALNEQLRAERRRVGRILARPENVRETADQIMDLAIETRMQGAPVSAGHA